MSHDKLHYGMPKYRSERFNETYGALKIEKIVVHDRSNLTVYFANRNYAPIKIKIRDGEAMLIFRLYGKGDFLSRNKHTTECCEAPYCFMFANSFYEYFVFKPVK